MHQVMKARAVPREIRMSSAHRRTFRSTFASTSSPIRGVANWDRFLVCHPHLFLFYLILLTSSVLAVATTDELLTQNMNVFNTDRKVFVCSMYLYLKPFHLVRRLSYMDVMTKVRYFLTNES